MSLEGVALQGPCLPPHPYLGKGWNRGPHSTYRHPVASRVAFPAQNAVLAKQLLRCTNGGIFGAAAKALLRITKCVTESQTL